MIKINIFPLILLVACLQLHPIENSHNVTITYQEKSPDTVGRKCAVILPITALWIIASTYSCKAIDSLFTPESLYGYGFQTGLHYTAWALWGTLGDRLVPQILEFLSGKDRRIIRNFQFDSEGIEIFSAEIIQEYDEKSRSWISIT